MVIRTTREAMYVLLEKKPQWKVVDIGSSKAGWEYADVFTDIKNYSKFYKKKYKGTKKFIQCNIENLPFRNKQFDFVIASHVLEHVTNPDDFCNELIRIGHRGYIETPTPLWYNLVTGISKSKYGHKWWITFDDSSQCIIFNKKLNIVNKVLSIKEHNFYMALFRESIVTQLYWDEFINIRMGDGIYTYNDNNTVNIKIDSNKWKDEHVFNFGNK